LEQIKKKGIFKNLGTDTITYGLSSILQPAISFLLIPIYTNYFTPSEYGILSLLYILSTFLVVVFGLGLPQAALRSYYDYDNNVGTKMVISTAFYILLINGVALITISYFSKEYLSLLLFQTEEYSLHIFLMSISATFILLNSLPITVFRAERKAKKYVSVQIVFFLIQIILTLLFVIIYNLNIFSIFLSNVIVSVLQYFTLYFLIIDKIGLVFEQKEFKKMLKFGLPLIPANMSAFIFQSSNRFFLNYFTGQAEVGIYSLSHKFGSVLTMVFARPISLSWPPIFFSIKDKNQQKNQFITMVTYSAGIGLWLFLLISLLSVDIINIMANPLYLPAAQYVPIMAFVAAMWAQTKVLHVGATLKRNTVFGAKLYFSGAIISIVSCYLLIPKFGISGAVISNLFTVIILTAINYYVNPKFINANLEWKRIIKLIMCALLIFIIPFSFVFDNIIMNIGFKILVIISYPVILFLVGFYTAGELKYIETIIINVINKIKGT